MFRTQKLLKKKFQEKKNARRQEKKSESPHPQKKECEAQKNFPAAKERRINPYISKRLQCILNRTEKVVQQFPNQLPFPNQTTRLINIYISSSSLGQEKTEVKARTSSSSRTATNNQQPNQKSHSLSPNVCRFLHLIFDAYIQKVSLLHFWFFIVVVVVVVCFPPACFPASAPLHYASYMTDWLARQTTIKTNREYTIFYGIVCCCFHCSAVCIFHDIQYIHFDLCFFVQQQQQQQNQPSSLVYQPAEHTCKFQDTTT